MSVDLSDKKSMQLESRFCEFGSELLIISRTVRPFHFLSFSMLSFAFLCFDTSSIVPKSLGSVSDITTN